MSEPRIRRPAPAVINAVQASCLAVAARPMRLAEEFYAQLFDMAPQLRSRFPADMTDQMQRMTETLLGAIARIAAADTEELEATLRRLGADHRTRYGVEPEHYIYIGHALTRAVREIAGAAYSGSLNSSWVAVYQWIAAHMMAGAEATEQAEPTPEPPRFVVPEPRGPQDDPTPQRPEPSSTTSGERPG